MKDEDNFVSALHPRIVMRKTQRRNEGNYARALPEEERAAGEMIADILPKIISGERPEILWEFTASYIGMEYREKVKPTKEAEEMRRKTREEIWQKLQEKGPYSEATVLLESLAEKEDFKIRTILRNIDNGTLAAAMYGASGRVVRRFFENLAETLLYYINEDMEQWHGTEEDILSAQRQVLELGAWAEGLAPIPE